MDIKTSSSINRSNFKLRQLAYSAAGGGKTWLGMTYPNPLYVTTEDGLTYFELRGNCPDHLVVETRDQLMKEVVPTILRTGDKYSSVVFDSLTEITSIVANNARKVAGKSHMDKHTWGVAVDDLRMFMAEFMHVLHKTHHILVTARLVIEKDELLGEIFAGPDTIGKYVQAVPGLFDLYTYHEAFNQWKDGKPQTEYRMYTTKYGRYDAKDRTGCLAAVEPNDFRIWSPKIFGAQEVK